MLLLLVDPELRRQPKRREPVDDAEIHGFGPVAILGVDRLGVDAEDLRRSQRVDVLARPVRISNRGPAMKCAISRNSICE